MKKLLLFIALLIGFTSFSQDLDPDLIKTWYLHAITIDNMDYSPADYGFYPDIIFEEIDQTISFSIETPGSVGCVFDAVSFSENPTSFQLSGDPACLTKPQCYDWPEDGPCSQIYGLHADFYFNTLQTPLNYTLITNKDETQTLEVTNENGNVSLYGNEPLLQSFDFSKI
ncbi:MAG TPA: hypothetical protein DEG69_00215, partial [Flavobacteriaceae bacterium]|nr:hypothetical protein [Flavobacteriaceae bacterium]